MYICTESLSAFGTKTIILDLESECYDGNKNFSYILDVWKFRPSFVDFEFTYFEYVRYACSFLSLSNDFDAYKVFDSIYWRNWLFFSLPL